MSSKHTDKDDRTDSPSELAEVPEGDGDARSRADTPRDASRVVNATSAFPVEGSAVAVEHHHDAELTRLDHYRLLGLIGRGGMGDVYRAHDESCNRTVAVKVLPPDLAEDATFVQRFEREAKAVAALSHPNIVAVYSIGEDQGHRYFSMAYIEGESLEDLLRRKRKLPLRETLHIVTQCLSALEAAHNKGLIHRDIKPANVLLQRHTGRAYLVDFGLVRQISETTRVTATGMVMGTVDYMAPEQARGMKDIDQRADLYAIGALLYHVLSGRLPFESTTLEGMMYGHAYEEPHPLDQAAPDLPRELVELVHRLLAKDRDARPAACHEVIEALAPLQQLDFQVRHLSGQLRSAASASESVAAAAGGDIPKSYGQLDRMRDRVTTIFRRPSPELLEALESADKELQPAIAECEQRRHRLVALRDEGRSLLEELQEQIQANLQAASEAMQQVEAAESDDARENALAKKKACDEHVAVLQAQSHELGERLDELELQLAKADTDLVTLQSRKDAVQGRIAIVKRPPKRLPAAAFIATIVVLLAGLVATPFIWKSLTDDSGTEAPKGTEGSPPPLAIAPFDAAQARQHQENWAKHLDLPVEKEIDLGGGQRLNMVLIPPGEFMMGSTQAEQIRFLEEGKAANDKWAVTDIPTEGPQHRVRITKPFWLSRHEVTQGQFGQFVKETGYKTDAERDPRGGVGRLDGAWVRHPQFNWSFGGGAPKTDQHPVENVSWHDAQAFCSWLSSQKRGVKFLLPSEAQWEYACRAGATTCWHCGDSEDVVTEYAWLNSNSEGTTHPVGQLRANSFGLFDMHGNVWEWCADWRSDDYYVRSPAEDPTGPTTGKSKSNRGGGTTSAARCRSARRYGASPTDSSIARGFRVAAVFDVPTRAAESNVTPEPARVAPGVEATAKVETLTHVRKFTGHTSAIYRVRFSPDGRFAASRSPFDGTVRIWDINTGVELQQIVCPRWPSWSPFAIAFSPDSKQIVTGDKFIAKLWDIESGKLLASFRNQLGAVAHALFTRDGKNVIISATVQSASVKPELDQSGTQGALWIYPIDAPDDGRLLVETSLVGVSGPMAISPDGTRVAVGFGGRIGQITVVDLATEKKISEWSARPTRIVYLSNDRLLTSNNLTNGYRVILFDANTGERLRVYPRLAPLQRGLAVTPDFRHAITADIEHKIYVWNIKTGEEVTSIETPDITIGLDVSADGKSLLSSGGVRNQAYQPGTDFDVHLWQLPESVWPENRPDDDAPRSDGSESNVPLDGDKELTPTKPSGKTNDNPQ